MANDKKSVPLVAYFKDFDESSANGVYLDVQLDQSGLTDQNVAEGKAKKNPYLATVPDNEGSSVHSVWYSREDFLKMREKASMLSAYDNYVIEPEQLVHAAYFKAPLETAKDEDGNNYLKFDSSKVEAPDEARLHKDLFSRQFDVTALAQVIDGSTVEKPFFTHQYNVNGFGEDVLADTKPNALIVNGSARSMYWGNPTIRNLYASEGIRHAVENDGRLYPFDYALMEDRAAFDKEFDNHDGYMLVAYDGELTMVNLATDNLECRNEMWGQLTDAGLSDKVLHGCVISWFDNVARQVERDELGLADHPSVAHENWSEKMEAFRLRCKENADNYGKPEKQTQVKTPVVEHEARSAAGKCQVNQPLIAVWTDKDIVKKADGSIKGAYIDVQVDQSTLSKKAIQSGAGFSSPSVHYAYSQNPERKPNKVFYTARQMDMMQSVGTTTEAGKAHGCSFTANVYTRESPSGKDTSFVLLPKDEASAKSNAELDDIRWYNSVNELKSSQHKDFGPAQLRRQFSVTSQVWSITKIDKDLESAFADKEQSAQTETEAVFG